MQNDFKKEFEYYTLAANNDDNGYATYRLAVMYFNGEYVIKDDTKVIELYKKSAKLGHYEAEFWLGLRYIEGRGVSENKAEAVRLIKASAAQNYSLAQVYLGIFYAEGYHTIKKDIKKSKYYLQLAIDQNNPDALKIWDKFYGE
jgi:TPR repeat protein